MIPIARSLAAASLAIVITRCAGAVPLAGTWTGSIEHAGVVAPLVVEIDANGKARLTAQESGVFDVPATLRTNRGALEGEIVRGDRTIRFRGHQNGQSIDGMAEAGTFIARVHLRRTGDSKAPRYVEIATIVPTEAGPRGATLLMPAGVRRPPAIVLIHGSHGPSREDLRGPAAIFARNGIAALIYDKRDLGADQSQPHRYSFSELASDARAAVNLLRARSDLDTAHIGIFGISEGGWFAPLVAADNNSVAFVIIVAAPVVSYAAVEDAVTRAELRKEGLPENEIAGAIALLHRTNEYVRHGGDAAALTRDLQAASRKPWAANIALPRVAPSQRDIQSDVRWREIDYDPAERWQHVRAPVFAAWGGDDEHPVADSVAAMRAALARAGNADVRLTVYPHATHELLVSPHGNDWQWPRLAPHFIDEMIPWTTAHARTALTAAASL